MPLLPARMTFLVVALISSVVAGLWWLSAPQTAPVDAAPGDFYLPWEPGQKIYTLQGQKQRSHLGTAEQFAYDFSLAQFDGSPFTVVASRAGTVKAVRSTSDESPDCDIRFYSLANQVLIDHGDGTGSMYSHLLKNSILVALGQKVAQGQPIARSDHSGYVCGTGHLHFTVLDISTFAGLDRPFADLDAQRDGGRPRTGQPYTADGAPMAGQMAPRAFLPFLRRGLR